MVKSLRLRFIFITMVSVVIVLFVLMLTVNLINYAKVNDYADTVLTSLARNGGTFGGFVFDDKWFESGISAETPFETRFFSVRYDQIGNVERVDVNRIAAVDVLKATEYAEQIIEKGKTQGYMRIYRYLVADTTDGGKLVICLDCTRQLATANNFLFASVYISVAGIIGVLVLVILLSKRVLAPVEKSYDRQRHFVTDASHELKTPLTIISANNELIEMEFGENESTQCITKQVARMSSMVKSLTMLAKIDEQAEIERAVFNLSDATIDLVESFVKMAQASQKEIALDIDDNVNYNGDEKLIRQLISILMDNAVKYSASKINVSLKKKKSIIELIVENDVTRLVEGDLDKCFDRFYRSEEMRASTIEGNGIGLSIAKEITELHDGKIHAFSKDEKSFGIVLRL